MATVQLKKLKPTPEDIKNGEAITSKAEIIAAIKQYKEKNPVKFEAKKEALFKKYELTDKDLKSE